MACRRRLFSHRKETSLSAAARAGSKHEVSTKQTGGHEGEHASARCGRTHLVTTCTYATNRNPAEGPAASDTASENDVSCDACLPGVRRATR